MNRCHILPALAAALLSSALSAAEPDFRSAYADYSALRLGFPKNEICQTVVCKPGDGPDIFTASVSHGEVTLQFDSREKLFRKTLSAKTRKFSPDYYAGLADGLAMRMGLLGRQGTYASDWLLANDDIFAEMTVRRDDVTVTVTNLRYPFEAWRSDLRRDKALRVKLPVFPSGFFVGEITWDRIRKAVRCTGDPESADGAVCRAPKISKEGVIVRTFVGTDVIKSVSVPIDKGSHLLERIRKTNPQLTESGEGILAVKGDEAKGGVRTETLADGRIVMTFFTAKPVTDYYEHLQGFKLLQAEVEKLTGPAKNGSAKQ